MNILIIGGSGFLSGTCVRMALAAGHQVFTITRGTRPVFDGPTTLIADRHDHAAFQTVVSRALESVGGSFDLVIDAIPFQPEDAEQDLAVFGGLTTRLVFVSTDFVYDPSRRRFPQSEDDADYIADGYGGKKRAAEQILLQAGTDELPWVVVRPGHIYGPGSQLGCLPPVGRDPQLIDRLRSGEPIELVGGGHFLQQPVFVEDLARVILDLGGVSLPDTGADQGSTQSSVPTAGTAGFAGGKAVRAPATVSSPVGQILNVAGPDVVESWQYYQVIADRVGERLSVTEIPVDEFQKEHPDKASFLCHRFYTMDRLVGTGVRPPETPLSVGLARHVESLISPAEE